MFIGIDVGRTHRDFAAHPAASSLPRRIPNTPEAIARLVRIVQTLTPTLIVPLALIGKGADFLPPALNEASCAGVIRSKGSEVIGYLSEPRVPPMTP